MQTEAQRAARWIAALEDLVEQEALALRAREFGVAQELQDRVGPLVGALADIAGTVTDEGMQRRLRAVQARRAESSAWLAGELDRAREELAGTRAARGRVAQIAPVYGAAPTAPRGSLSCVG